MKYNPKSTEILSGRGRVFMKQENFDGALECFNNALKIEPKNKIALEGKKNVESKIKKKFIT